MSYGLILITGKILLVFLFTSLRFRTKYNFKMLKWAVNGSRQTYLQNGNTNMELPVSSVSSSQQRRKSKSSDLSALERKASWLDSTSTPLHTSDTRFLKSPSRRVDSLKDLSNITPELVRNFLPNLLARKVSPKTPESIQTRKNVPNNYASTLPSFDVEYSPCGVIPGPMLALRGVGIPDSYFEKPRYITPHLKKSLNSVNEQVALETKSLEKPDKSILKYNPCVEESTLSSTKMGDITLERMIDAILESNSKQRNPAKAQKMSQQQSNMSPTYTPAEDPASDLHEVWDSEKARYRQKELKFRAKLTKKILFHEREICSPLLQESFKPAQLRRQRGLRRKRKINQISESVVSSAQKVLRKGAYAQSFCAHSHNLSKEFDTVLAQNEILLHPCKILRNLSPDSGHNSSSDYEEKNADSTLEYTTDNTKTFDNMKRKLSFSLQNINLI